MKLALRLGKTLGELSQIISSSELALWVAFDQISPIGDERGDYQAAQIVAAAYNTQGGDIDLSDAVLRWSEPEEVDEWAEVEARLKQLAT